MTQLEDRRTLDLSLPDSEVIERVLAGETALFEIIMRRYNRRLYRAAKAIVKDDDEAEQVIQEAYFLAYTHLGQFAGRAKFSTWLTRIAVHEALARLRRRGRFVDLESVPESEREKSMFVSARRDPEQQLLDGEIRNLLEQAVERLPEHYRSVLVMRDVEGLDTEETSECLGITQEAVKTRLHRARALVRDALYTHAGDALPEIFQFHQSRCDRIVAAVFNRIAALP